MGIIHHQHDCSLTTLAIWEISESLEALYKTTRLNKQEIVTYKNFKQNKRRREWLATRHLLQTINKYKNCEINYNKEGKPTLNNGFQLSISHSKGFVALLIHPTATVGIDIQVSKPNINKATQLFMSKKELTDLGECKTEQKLDKLHIYWCAKEALYKYASNSTFSLDNDFTISPFKLQKKGVIKGHIRNTEHETELFYLVEPNYYCVYTKS